MTPINFRPVLQTTFDNEGNCVAACWASLLGLGPYYLPTQLPPGPSWDQEEAFARRHGYGLVRVIVPPAPYAPPYVSPGVFHMITGGSPRDPTMGHRVVGLGGAVFHDPHPDQTGVLLPLRYIFLVGL